MSVSQTMITKEPEAQTAFEAVNFVNRINFFFDRWEVEHLLASFTDDVIVDHPLGRSVGKPALSEFLKAYEPITHGVRRHNANHVVDTVEGGDVRVTYYILLVRIAPSSEAQTLKEKPMSIMEYDEHFPKLISYAQVTDTLTRAGDGQWKVRHKRVENVAEDKVHHF
ncbi:nuclear transport factor 2 family protein [Rhizobium sp. Rhizsp82]|uniref:nuclear transport factor 2 family protein n=1 Tax=Rhizobium sp. Rhizsp82 TaxID=3243057 RepID=UPI0039B44018